MASFIRERLTWGGVCRMRFSTIDILCLKVEHDMDIPMDSYELQPTRQILYPLT